jgi:hypothetical protein
MDSTKRCNGRMAMRGGAAAAWFSTSEDKAPNHLRCAGSKRGSSPMAARRTRISSTKVLLPWPNLEKKAPLKSEPDSVHQSRSRP